MGLFGLLDGLYIFVTANFPNGLQHQRSLPGQQPLLHFLYCAATRWASIVGIILTTKVVLTVLAKGRICHDLSR